MNRQSACLSVINKIELPGYDGPEDEMQIVAEFIRNCQLLSLSEEIAEIAIRIRKGTRIKLPDAIIAATAMHHGLVLVTRNVKDFDSLPGIEIINPHEL
jgi:predicted nucleic acid-binding protein